MDFVFLEPVRMGGDLIKAGQFGISHYLGWNPNEPDWRSRLARDVSLGEKSNQDILFKYEKENLARGACLIGGKVAGDLPGKTFRWLRNRGSVAPIAFDPFVGTGSNAGFGRLIGWGTGAQGASARAASITLQEIQAAGITRPVAEHWLNFYRNAVANGQGGAAAPERVRLMQQVIELLGG